MNIDVIFKIAAIGVLTAVINQVLKMAGKEEIATLVTLAGIVIVLLSVVTMISDLFNTVKSLFNVFQMRGVFGNYKSISNGYSNIDYSGTAETSKTRICFDMCNSWWNCFTNLYIKLCNGSFWFL